MPDKPTYLGLLNAISLAETRAHDYFEAWIAVTPSPDVRTVLRTVSCREGEHGMAFAKRINELGYELDEKDDPRHEEAMRVASSDLPDVEKFRRLGLADFQLSVFDNVFRDHTIDIQTGGLLGRYVAEEFDSIRRLHDCYEQLAGAEAGHQGDEAVDGPAERLTRRVDDLCRLLGDLRETVTAQRATMDELRQALVVQGGAVDDLRATLDAHSTSVDELRQAANRSGAAPVNGDREPKRARR